MINHFKTMAAMSLCLTLYVHESNDFTWLNSDKHEKVVLICESADTSYDPNYKIVDTIKMQTDIRVDEYSIDSIIATVTFTNMMIEPIVIYRPRLPIGSCLVPTFAVFHKDLVNMRPIHSYSKSTLDAFTPKLIQHVNGRDLLKLESGAKFSFSVNLSKCYDFRNTRIIYVDYDNIFPLIQNGKHVVDDAGDFAKPIYFSASSITYDKDGVLERHKFVLSRR